MFTRIALIGLTMSTIAVATPDVTQDTLLDIYNGLAIHRSSDGRVDRIYGRPFSTGDTAVESAETFLAHWADVWGLTRADLRAIGPFEDGRHQLGLMPDRLNGGYRFTGVYYTQWVGDWPVHGGRLCLLTRTTPRHELVMAAADLRDVSGFDPVAPAPEASSIERSAQIARALMGPGAQLVDEPRLVVFAGVDDDEAEPRLALRIEARVGTAHDGEGYRRMLYLVDVHDGGVLHEENRVLNCGLLHGIAATTAGDVSGTAAAWAGDGYRAEECDPEDVLALPYAVMTINGTTVQADGSGAFTFASDPDDTVSIQSYVAGAFFVVNNQAGADSLVNIEVADGESGDFMHNEDATEFTFAEVDTYIAANNARDMVLVANPDYPTVSTETSFPINVNLSDTCNAYYDYSSINFYSSGGGCNNTGFGSVTHHEYGHHLIASGGSGQGEYGEGMSDCIDVIMTLDPRLGVGFFQGNCESGIRNADNSCQYQSSGCSSCGSAIHSCGQLLSGCVYDLWERLQATAPFTALQTLRDLTVNSIPLHSGTSIDDTITIDFLVLDDDDGDIGNGTPHYSEIADAFGAHGMPAPQLDWLSMNLPDGAPSWIDADGGDVLRVAIEDGLGTYAQGTARMYVRVDGDYQQVALTEAGGDLFEAVFPETICGDDTLFWFAANTTDGDLHRLPDGAPSTQFSTISAQTEPVIAFHDDCTTDPGWTVTGDATDGFWERGIPAGGNNRPQTDCDVATSFCWITENTAGGGGDVDGGETILVSPVIDATGVQSVSYCYWYRNIGGGQNVEDDVFRVDISDDDGATWTNILTVGPTGPGTTGEWTTEEAVFADVPDFEVNDLFRIRFNASDLNETSRVEAAIDNVSMVSIDCESSEPECPADVTGDGSVDVNDVLALLSAWGDCDGCPEDVDGSGAVEVNDLLAVLAGWGDC